MKIKSEFLPCKVEGCDRNSHRSGYGRGGMCNAHFKKQQKYGDPTVGRVNLTEHDDSCAIEGCTEKYHSGGYCSRHWAQMRKHGEPIKLSAANGEPRVWLEDHVSYQGLECLIWPFGRGAYGSASVSKTIDPSGVAARAMCRMKHGDPPSPDHEAAHNCGKGHLACVNPNHLRWATHKENMEDSVSHGTTQRGERQAHAKLTEPEVREILVALRNGAAPKVLAPRYGVSRQTIEHIDRKRTWRHVSIGE